MPTRYHYILEDYTELTEPDDMGGVSWNDEQADRMVRYIVRQLRIRPELTVLDDGGELAHDAARMIALQYGRLPTLNTTVVALGRCHLEYRRVAHVGWPSHRFRGDHLGGYRASIERAATEMAAITRTKLGR